MFMKHNFVRKEVTEMTDKQRQIITRINEYAEKALADIDPTKTKVSVQLEKLRPILTTIAAEENVSLEEMFIQYMDLASELAVEKNNKFKDDYADMPESFSQMANTLQ